MKKVKLFIAMSIDGYIADSNGNVEWLEGHSNDDSYDSYSEFIKDIDTIIMGSKTYQQIVTELSPDKWIYEDLTTYVVTHNPKPSTEEIHFVNESLISLVDRLRKQQGMDIWICGGANIIQQLVKADIIDDYHITLIPTILGSGIRLFENIDAEIKLKLIKTHSYNGMTDLIYTKR